MSFSQQSNNTDNDQIEESKPQFCSIAVESYGSAMSRQIMNPSKAMTAKTAPANSMGKSRWAVNVAKPVPMWGLLSGTKFFDEESAIVSSRIDESLRLRSVEARFDVDQAEADCKTDDFLCYKIYLYAGREGGTHVEVMRTQGCGFAFRKERQAIMNAAKGLGGKQMASFGPRKLTIPADLLASYVPPSIDDLENALHRACDQFHSNNRQVLLFALQNLATMTAADKVHAETASNMCKLIMQNRCNVRDMIVLIYSSEAQSMADAMSEEICAGCLRVLANSIVSMPSKNDDNDGDDAFIREFVACLVHGVSNYRCTANNACLALTCLFSLLSRSKLACMKAKEMNANMVLEQARQYGSVEHFKLEQTARSTIDILQKQTIVI